VTTCFGCYWTIFRLYKYVHLNLKAVIFYIIYIVLKYSDAHIAIFCDVLLLFFILTTFRMFYKIFILMFVYIKEHKEDILSDLHDILSVFPPVLCPDFKFFTFRVIFCIFCYTIHIFCYCIRLFYFLMLHVFLPVSKLPHFTVLLGFLRVCKYFSTLVYDLLFLSYVLKGVLETNKSCV
jgi:hypothetical protein